MLKLKSLVIAAVLLRRSRLRDRTVPAARSAAGGWRPGSRAGAGADPPEKPAPQTTAEVDSFADRGSRSPWVMLMGSTSSYAGSSAHRRTAVSRRGDRLSSSAARAGVRVGDVITRVSGQAVSSVDDIIAAIAPPAQNPKQPEDQQQSSANARRVMIEVVRDHRTVDLRAMMDYPKRVAQPPAQPQQPSPQQTLPQQTY